MSDQPHNIQQINRRRFLQLTGIASGGLILGVTTSCTKRGSVTANGSFAPNAFLNVSPDNQVTVYVHKPEMGQGVNTSLAMIIADEMDAAWDNVQVTTAPIDEQRYGPQEAVASGSIVMSWVPLRRAAATARAMLVSAAAAELDVAESDLSVNAGYVSHEPSGRKRSFGELAATAAVQRKPLKYFLRFKEPSQYKILGTAVPSIDATNIVLGKQTFSIDQQLPDMCYSVYATAPNHGASLIKANLSEVKAQTGVLDVVTIEGDNNAEGLRPGIAIIASDSWSALQARKKLKATWTDDGANDSWSAARTEALKLAGEDGPIAVATKGEPATALASSQTQVTASYEYHFIAHAQLEPLCCTAWLRDDKLDLWCASQSPQGALNQAATLVGLPSAQVELHQLRGGGGFGRRLYHDIVLEAAAIAKHTARPVQLLRSREDEMHAGFHRAGGIHHLQAGLDANNQLKAWQDHFVSFSKNGTRSVRGGGISADDFPTPLVTNAKVTQTLLDWQTPVGNFRAPGSNVLSFVNQSFLGELSSNAGVDHLEFLLQLLGEPRWLEEGNLQALNTGRAATVLKEAAKLGNWGTSLPTGQGLGIAFNFSQAGYFAEVAKVTVGPDKQLSVQEVSVVGDVGPIINLSGALAQCEGSVMDGLSILLGQKITLEEGICQQTNFDHYPVLRINQAPKINVRFIQTWDTSSGLGEPALPPLAPAVGNAIFAASGHRVRTLPFSEEGYHS